jgi:hypothetical protein
MADNRITSTVGLQKAIRTIRILFASLPNHDLQISKDELVVWEMAPDGKGGHAVLESNNPAEILTFINTLTSKKAA